LFGSDRYWHKQPQLGVVLARGRFAEVKIEALMREHGAQVEVYKASVSSRLLLRSFTALPAIPRFPLPRPVPRTRPSADSQSFSLTFVESGLVALGTTNLVQHVVDLHTGAAKAR